MGTDNKTGDRALPVRKDSRLNHYGQKSVRRLPLPVGVSDYRRAQTEYYYVDKTLLIKDNPHLSFGFTAEEVREQIAD